MSATDRAMMLGIRHRCGQEVQFWIPAYLVAPIIGDMHSDDVLGLAGWMQQEGMLVDEASAPEDLLGHLRQQLEPRDVAFIDVESDASVCPGCGGMLPWIDAVTEYVSGYNRGEF